MCGLQRVDYTYIQGMRLQDFSDTIVNSTTQKMMDVVRFTKNVRNIFTLLDFPRSLLCTTPVSSELNYYFCKYYKYNIMYLPLSEILDTEFEKENRRIWRKGMEEMILLFETFYKWKYLISLNRYWERLHKPLVLLTWGNSVTVLNLNPNVYFCLIWRECHDHNLRLSYTFLFLGVS